MKFRTFRRSFRILLLACISLAGNLGAGSLWTGCSTAMAQTNAEQVLTIGRNVLSMNDYMLAIQYFNQAIKAKPYLSDPYFFRAIAKLYLDDFEGAGKDCDLAIERNKFKTEAYKVRGFARQMLGRDSLAIEDYNVGLAYNPTDRSFLFYKATALTELKKFNEADSVFESLLRQYPSYAEGFTGRARMHMLEGDTIKALDDIDHSLSLSKSQLNPYLMRAEIYWKEKNWDEAGDAMDAAIRLNPEMPDLYVNRAFIRYNSDDFFGAMSDYNYALEIDPDNISALFNRGLLRYEVKDLENAESDLSAVLNLTPDNFPALFNRGLIRLERNKNKEALKDFDEVMGRYPRFYPVYYAIAEARQKLGDMSGAARAYNTGETMVEKYVEDPVKNPLEMPAIAAAESNEYNHDGDLSEEDEMEVMAKFNRLMTVSNVSQTELSYNEKIKGRVQDRNVNIDIEPSFAISLAEAPVSLKNASYSFKELEDLNNQRLIQGKFYLTPGLLSESYTDMTPELFDKAEKLMALIEESQARPVDNLTLGVILTMLKNYSDALPRLDDALMSDPAFTVAYMARGFARYSAALAELSLAGTEESEADVFLDRRAFSGELQEALQDFDKALNLDPNLVYAWFNKGNIYYGVGDYTSALQCYSEALRIDPDFGQAFFNRGLSYLQAGNRQQAFNDLSKAGELGILPSYNILKRMK